MIKKNDKQALFLDSYLEPNNNLWSSVFDFIAKTECYEVLLSFKLHISLLTTKYGNSNLEHFDNCSFHYCGYKFTAITKEEYEKLSLLV